MTVNAHGNDGMIKVLVGVHDFFTSSVNENMPGARITAVQWGLRSVDRALPRDLNEPVATT